MVHRLYSYVSHQDDGTHPAAEVAPVSDEPQFSVSAALELQAVGDELQHREFIGGPGHLRPYREPGERADLKAIDAAFWAKYQAVKAGDEFGLERCYTDPGSAR
jgi:hypothetical protein